MTSAISIRKSFRILTFALLALVLLVIMASASVSIIYKKALIRYMKGYLGEHLRTELTMDDIRIRLLKGFPKVTIEVSDVVLHSGDDFSENDFPSWSDTLLQAKSLYLQFDLLKMLNKQFELKKIEITDGIVNVLYDKDDRHNLSVWKSGDSTGKSYSVNLRNIEVSNTNIRVYVLGNQFALNGKAVKLQFKGSLNNNILSGDVRGNVKIRNTAIKDKSLSRNSNLQLDIKMAFGEKHFRISQGKVQLNKAVSDLTLEYAAGNINAIDLSIDIPKFGLDELMSIIPFETRFSTGKYRFSGGGRLHLSIKGNPARKNTMLIRSDFILDQCTARNINTRSSITDLEIHGNVSGTNSNDFVLRIDTLNARMGSGFLRGKIAVNNLEHLYFKSEMTTLIDLKVLKEFAGIDSIDDMFGMVYADFRTSGRFKTITDSSRQALNMLESGNFRFENAGLKIKKIPLEIKGITGKAKWNESVRLDSMTLTVNESEVLVSGDLQNLTGYLLHQGILKANLQVSTDKIDITKILKGSSNGSNSERNLFPERIRMNGLITTRNFIAGRFEASDVKVEVKAVKDSLYLKALSFRFPDGSINGRAMITIGPEHEYQVQCSAHPQNINIQQLFYSCNNFTQHFIIDKNLRGQLEGNIDCSFQWDSSMRLIPQSIIAEGDFKIVNGELVQFEPMLKLSKYIDIDELRHIRFSTLQNTIHINNKMVDIPEMDIHSSAFNIRVSGKHSFNNEFDYSLRVLLSEVLFNKARKKKKEIDEFLIEDRPQDRTTIPLIIAGTPDNFDVHFDRKKAFGLSSGRTKTNALEGKPNTNQNVRIEWEDPKPDPIKKETGSSTSKPSDVVIEWEE